MSPFVQINFELSNSFISFFVCTFSQHYLMSLSFGRLLISDIAYCNLFDIWWRPKQTKKPSDCSQLRSNGWVAFFCRSYDEAHFYLGFHQRTRRSPQRRRQRRHLRRRRTPPHRPLTKRRRRSRPAVLVLPQSLRFLYLDFLSSTAFFRVLQSWFLAQMGLSCIQPSYNGLPTGWYLFGLFFPKRK